MSSPRVRQHMPNIKRLKHMHTGPVCEVSMRCLSLVFRLAMLVSVRDVCGAVMAG
jgi:hypothetical protein